MFELWMIYAIIAVIALFIEIIFPTLFCINFAIAGIIVAVLSAFWGNNIGLAIIFILLSLLSIIFIKPLLGKLLKKDTKADFNAQYIGKVVKVIETITTTKGAVTIYDERWEARTKKDNEEIEVNSDVRIVDNDGLILYVEKI